MTRTGLVLAVASTLSCLGGASLAVVGFLHARRDDGLQAMTMVGLVLLASAIVLLLLCAVWLLSGARRSRESLRVQGVRTGERVERLLREVTDALPTLSRDLSAVMEAVRSGEASVRAALEEDEGPVQRTLRSELERGAALDGALGKLVRRENSALYGQIEGMVHLERALDLPRPLGPLGGFAVRADLAAHLMRLCRSLKPRQVVEMGSGMSTVLLAAALRQSGGGHVLALEHDPSYADVTREILDEYGVAAHATVIDAPLIPVEVEGEAYRWYDLSQLEMTVEIDLLFVDGPPGSSGPLARFPAVPLLSDRLSATAIVVLDDAGRSDEWTAVERWEALLPGHTVRYLDHLVGTAEFHPRKT